MMFAQLIRNTAAIRSSTPNGRLDGEKKVKRFRMIRATHKAAPQFTITAYADNAAIFEGRDVERLYPRPSDGGSFRLYL